MDYDQQRTHSVGEFQPTQSFINSDLFNSIHHRSNTVLPKTVVVYIIKYRPRNDTIIVLWYGAVFLDHIRDLSLVMFHNQAEVTIGDVSLLGWGLDFGQRDSVECRA